MSRQIDDRTREILAASTLDGARLTLPPGQLARDEYVRVNKVLEALGGKWDRRTGTHVFSSDPGTALAAALGDGVAPLAARAAEGYVPTPAGLAAAIVRDFSRVPHLPEGSSVLEPSAGDGAFVFAIRNANPDVTVWAVEPHAERAARISDGSGEITLVVDTLENFAGATAQRFDAVVMNPPFAVPGQPTIWIDHVRLAWELLAPGGRLVAIVPAGYIHRSDRRHSATRSLVAEYGEARELPSNAFGGVQTWVLWLDRPAVAEAAA